MKKLKLICNVLAVLAVLATVVFISCDAFFGNEQNVTINLPPISSSARAISSDKISDLKNVTTSYRVTANGITREGAGGAYTFTLPVGMVAEITVECLNSSGNVIVRAKKTHTVTAGVNNVDIILSRDGDVVGTGGGPAAPQPVPGKVTYNGNGADSGTPSDTQTYDTGNEVTLQTDEPARAGYEFAGWTADKDLKYIQAGSADEQTIPQGVEFASTNSNVATNIKITSFKMPSGGVVLTAKWTAAAATVTINGVETNYYDFSTAWAAADGQTATVKMYQDATGVSVTLTGGNVTLNLNGKTLRGNGTAAVIELTGGSFTLEDSGSGKITGGSRGVKVDGGGGATFTMNSGEISGITSTEDGAGVYVSGGGGLSDKTSFNMTGGKIINNTTSGIAGGVYVGGTFEMSGTAVISGNTASAGGGVFIDSDKFTMSGGEITGNNAKENNANDFSNLGGGGVYINPMGEFEMTGGVISNNTTAAEGGGVWLIGPFTMNGGTIRDNKAKGSGGGVSVCHSFDGTGGTLSGNKAFYDESQPNGGANVKDSDYYLDNGTCTHANKDNWIQEI